MTGVAKAPIVLLPHRVIAWAKLNAKMKIYHVTSHLNSQTEA